MKRVVHSLRNGASLSPVFTNTPPTATAPAEHTHTQVSAQQPAPPATATPAPGLIPSTAPVSQTDTQPAPKPPAVATTLQKCAKFGKAGGGMLQCTRCKGVVYCNTTCQSGHWQAHRVVCLPPPPAAPAAASVSGGQTDTPTKQPPAKVGRTELGKHRVPVQTGGTPAAQETKRGEKLQGRREALLMQIERAADESAAVASGGFDTSAMNTDIDRLIEEVEGLVEE